MTDYIAQKGDTLNKIANRYGFANYKEAGLTAKSGNPDLIYPGESFGIANKVAPAPTVNQNIAGPSGYSTGDTSPAAIAWRKSQGMTEPSTVINTPADTGLTPTDTRYGNVIDPYDPAVLAEEKANLEREKELKRQGLIDAINSKYSYKSNLITKSGEESLARQRSMNLRSGTIDSPLGDTEIAKTKKLTEEDLKANRDAQSAEITSAMTDLDTAFETKRKTAAEERMTQAEYEATQRTNRMAEASTRKTELATKLAILGKNGVDFEKFKLDPVYTKLKDEGFSDMEMQAMINDAKPKPDSISYDIIGNNIVSYYTDPTTGKVVVNKNPLPEGINNPDNISVEKLGDGSLVYFDKVAQKVVGTIKSNGTGNQTKDEILRDARQIVAPQLSSVAGDDGYISPEDYKIAKRSWIENAGLLGQDFDSAFVSYINPAHTPDYGFDKATFDSLKKSPTFIIQQ